MIAFIFLLVICGAGLLAVGWLIVSEKLNEKKILVEPIKDAAQLKPAVEATDVLKRLDLEVEQKQASQKTPTDFFEIPFSFFKKKPAVLKNSSSFEQVSKDKIKGGAFFSRLFQSFDLKKQKLAATPLRGLPEEIKKGIAEATKARKDQQQALESGTAGLRIQSVSTAVSSPVQPVDQVSVKKETERSLQMDELKNQFDGLKEKHQILVSLHEEKLVALEKAEQALGYEQKNRKDFNKVKDVLEKELKEVKDQSRAFQVAAKNSEMEAQSYQKRVNQLENKVKEVEKEVFVKEDDLKSAQKESQTFKAKISELEKSLLEERHQLEEKKQKINELVEKIKGVGQRDSGKQNDPRSPVEELQNAPEQIVAESTAIADSTDKRGGGQLSAVPQDPLTEDLREQVKQGDGIHLAPDRITQELKKIEARSVEKRPPSPEEILNVQDGEQKVELDEEREMEGHDRNENKNST